MAEIENLKIGNGGTLHIVGNEDIVANAWQAGKTYVKNKSYVIREHRLYVCNVTHTSVEPFDATKWTEITIGDAIGNNIGDLSQLTTTDKSSLVGAVNEVNNLPLPTTSITSARSDIVQWNTSVVPNTRAGTINVFFVFNNSGTAQPMITHSITCSRNILSMSMIGFNMTTGTNSASASYDNGNIKWNTGLLQGIYICMGTIVFE